MAILAIPSGSPELATDKEALEKGLMKKRLLQKWPNGKIPLQKIPLEGKSCRKNTIWKKAVGNAITCSKQPTWV